MPRLLFITTEYWSFQSHKLEMAAAARDAGFDFITTSQSYLNAGPPTHSLATIPLLARLAAIPFRLSRPELAAFLIVVMFSNGGNYGLPVVSFAFGAEALAFRLQDSNGGYVYKGETIAPLVNRLVAAARAAGAATANSAAAALASAQE